MGYNLRKALSRSHLDPGQRKRFDELTARGATLSSALQERLRFVDEYVKPISGGEAAAALRELREDVFVRWILAEEDAFVVAWLDPRDLTGPATPLTTDQILWDTEEALAQEKRYRKIAKIERVRTKMRSKRHWAKIEAREALKPLHQKVLAKLSGILLWMAASLMLLISVTYILASWLWNGRRPRRTIQ